MAAIAAGGEISVVNLLGDDSDIGVIGIFQLSLRSAGDEFQWRRGRAKHGAASGCSGPRPQPNAPEPRHHHLQRGPQRQAPVLCSLQYSLELLRQGPDLLKVHPLAQA
jgi:hypothetical protein